MRYLLLFVTFLASSSLWSCTAFQLQSQDGASIYCRTMEYSFPLQSDLLVVGRDTPYTSTLSMKWKTKYGFVGMNQCLAPQLVSDGMNEKGLVVGSLYLLGFAHYEAEDPTKKDHTLGPWELASYLLGKCATVDEVKQEIGNLLVAHVPFPYVKDFILPLHYYVCDREGKMLVIEYLAGKAHLLDNPIGVLTNAPPLSWQLINLTNYINLSPVNVPQLDLKNFAVKNHSEGSGLLGLPGDYTPTSRFVRAAFFSHWAQCQKDADSCVALGFHILNTFDIFDGIVRAKESCQSAHADITEWSIVHDRTSLKSYFRSYESLQIQMVDLKKLPFERPGFSMIELKRRFEVKDESSNLKPLVEKEATLLQKGLQEKMASVSG